MCWDLADAAARERHRIYCHLLMKLIVRFWNGNKHGPQGSYPLRAQQRIRRNCRKRYRAIALIWRVAPMGFE